MSAIDHAKALGSLLRRLKGEYEAPEPVERNLLEEFLYSFLLWESSHAKAELALKRLLHSMVDVNELRVARPPELIGLMGKQYPRVEERAQRMRAALNELYVREYAVSLESLRPMGKREARQYLESLEGVPPFVAARVVLLRLDGHAVPIDDRTLAKLVHVHVIEPNYDVTHAESTLERHIKSGEALRAHDLLQAWSEDPNADQPPKPAPKKPEPEPKAEAEPKSAKPAAKPAGTSAKRPASKPARPSNTKTAKR